MSGIRKRYCVFGCDAIVTLGVPFHQFPHPERRPALFTAWVSAVGDKLEGTDSMKIYKNKRICDLHFDSTCKISTGRLTPSAIPSIFLNRVQQSVVSFVEADHSYSRAKRENLQPVPMTAITNLRGPPRSAGDSTVMPVPSACMSANCLENVHARTSHTKFDAAGLPVSLHRFPNPEKRPELFAAWVSVAGDKLKETDPKRIFQNKKVCDYHFDHASLIYGGRILRSAVPTTNLQGMQQSIRIIVDSDHSYCDHRRFRLNYIPSATVEGGSEKYIKYTFRSTRRTLKTADRGLNESKPDDATEDAATEDYDHGEDSPKSETAADTAVEENKIFSWQQTEYYITEDATAPTVAAQEVPVARETDQAEVSLYQDDESKGIPGETAEDYTYRCNNCGENIIGFRYTCVQCCDWDLCGTCEARAAHAAHYVLRVPRHRPYKETQAMLAAIRHQLHHDNVFYQNNDDSVKVEVKVEPVVTESGSEADPLLCVDIIEKDLKKGALKGIKWITDHRPLRKRPRLLTNTDDNSTNHGSTILIDSDTDNDTEVNHDKPKVATDIVHDNPKEIAFGIHKRLDAQREHINKEIPRRSKRPHQPETSAGTVCADTKRAVDVIPKFVKDDSTQTPMPDEITTASLQTPKEAFPTSDLKPKLRRLLVKVPPGTDPKDFIHQLQRDSAFVRLTALTGIGHQNTSKRLK